MNIKFNNLSSQYTQIQYSLNCRFEELFSSSAFINGQDVSDFESEFSEYIGVKHSIGVSNGTDAIKLAAQSLNLEGSTIAFIPANTFIATVLGIEQAIPNVKIELIDCDNDYLMDLNVLLEKLEKYRKDYKNSIIVPVHLYGKSLDMVKLMNLAYNFESLVIEDASQAHGAEFNNKKVGSYGLVSAFSCYPGKNLGAAGDAGVITTDSTIIADRIKLLRNLGSKVKYQHEIKGFNHRLDSIQAIVLSEKLKYLDKWNKLRINIANRYINEIKNPDIILPAPSLKNNHVYHIFCIRVKDRDLLENYLKDNTIEYGIHYPVLIEEMEIYKNLGANNLKSRQFSKEILSLPIYPHIPEDEVSYVIDKLNKF